MSDDKRKIGKIGEEIAAEFLANKGYQIIEKNYYSRYGEIDLVAWETGSVIFVEVKTRTNQAYGAPETSVTQKKLDRIEKAALMWMQAHPNMSDDWRIEVVAILIDELHQVQDIRHFKDIYT